MAYKKFGLATGPDGQVYFWRPPFFHSLNQHPVHDSIITPLAVHIYPATSCLYIFGSHHSLVNHLPVHYPRQSISATAKMRLWIPFTLAFYAVVAFAQNNKINIPAGASTLSVVAGQVTTITWSDPSSSTVTIKLQQNPITPTSGFVLACTWKAHPSPSTTKCFTSLKMKFD